MAAMRRLALPRRGSSAVWLLLAVWAACVCGNPTIERNDDDCAYPEDLSNPPSFFPNTQYMARGNRVFVDNEGAVTVVNNAGFTIRYFPTYKIVTNNVAKESYVLYQCGTRPPALPASAGKLMTIPLASSSANDASAADYVVQLVMLDRVAYASEFAVASCLQTLSRCGYIAPDPTDARAKDLDKNVDAFWSYGASANPKSIAFSAVTASTPLARSEWLRYTSAFYNKEWQANAFVTRIRNAYRASRLRALEAARSRSRTVCWVGKNWDGDFVFSTAPYKVTYVEDAGGRMPTAAVLKAPELGGFDKFNAIGFNANQPNLQGRWAAALNLCDVIVDESYVQTTGGLVSVNGTDGWLAQYGLTWAFASAGIKALRSGQVYSLAGTTSEVLNDARFSPWAQGGVALDWFERGVSRADEVLKDFIKVTQPTADIGAWNLRWLLQLDGSRGQQRLPASCRLNSAKLDARCQRVSLAVRVCPNSVRDCDTGIDQYPPLSKRCDAVRNQNLRVRQRVRDGLPACVGPV